MYKRFLVVGTNYFFKSVFVFNNTGMFCNSTNLANFLSRIACVCLCARIQMVQMRKCYYTLTIDDAVHAADGFFSKSINERHASYYMYSRVESFRCLFDFIIISSFSCIV